MLASVSNCIYLFVLRCRDRAPVFWFAAEMLTVGLVGAGTEGRGRELGTWDKTAV